MSTIKVKKPPPPLIARIEKWMPGVRALRNYQRGWLPRDLVAGIVLSTLLIPQGMAYAELAGLPPITGLYTTVVCLVAYALFGPSPYLVLGPDSSLGPMIAAVILPLAAGDVEYAIALAGMLALMVGAINIGAGVARLGFVADLISKPVRVGYLAGLAITIFVGQLPKLFGYSTDADGFIEEIGAAETKMNTLRHQFHFFIRFLAVWFVDTISLLVTAWLIPGINFNPVGNFPVFVVATATASDRFRQTQPPRIEYRPKLIPSVEK